MELLGFIGVADRIKDNSSERQGQSVSPGSVHFFHDCVDQKRRQIRTADFAELKRVEGVTN